jgi:four helix bundle protein
LHGSARVRGYGAVLANLAGMSRDHRKLRVCDEADGLVIDIYQATKGFPPEEKYGLRAQIRRAAVSCAANIVEGCARRTTKDYLNFCNIAVGSACEVRYLLGLSRRLGMLDDAIAWKFDARCDKLIRGLMRLIESLELQMPDDQRDRPPQARGRRTNRPNGQNGR